MSVLVRPLAGLVAMLVVGTILDHLFLLLPRRAFARWPLRVVFGLAALYLATALPRMGVAVAVAGCVARLVSLRKGPKWAKMCAFWGDRPGASRLGARDLFVALAVVASISLVVAGRTWVPLYWDEFVWLAKARIEADHPFGLVGEVLRANTSAIPLGYPPLEPLSVAALAGWSSDTSSLVVGTALLQIVLATAFGLLALDRSSRAERRPLALVLALAMAPLVVIHLRSAYVDLETGLLAGTLLLLLELGLARAAALVAIVLVGMKDEGTIHLVAVTSAVFFFGLLRRQSSVVRNAVTPLLAGLATFALWHVELARAGISRTDHALGHLAYARLGEFARLAFAHATDLLSWGALWAVAFGVVVAVVVRPGAFGRVARLRSFALASQVVVFAVGLLATGDRVMAFAREGTLMGRLLVELVPVALLTIVAALGPAPFVGTARDR